MEVIVTVCVAVNVAVVRKSPGYGRRVCRRIHGGYCHGLRRRERSCSRKSPVTVGVSVRRILELCHGLRPP